MNPLVRLRVLGQLDGGARAAKVYVGNESVKAMSVPIDAEPDHVPTGVIGKADAEDGELSFVEGIAGAPENRKRAALRVNIAGRPVGEQLVVAALNVGSADAVGKNFDVVLIVGDGIAAGSVVGVEAVVTGEIEEQAGLGGVEIGWEDRVGGGRGVLDRHLGMRGYGEDERGKGAERQGLTAHGKTSGWELRPER